MQKYIKLTWNGGRTLTLKWEDYLKNKNIGVTNNVYLKFTLNLLTNRNYD